MPLSEIPPPIGADPGQDEPWVRVPPPGPLSRTWMTRLSRVETPSGGARKAPRDDPPGASMATSDHR